MNNIIYVNTDVLSWEEILNIFPDTYVGLNNVTRNDIKIVSASVLCHTNKVGELYSMKFNGSVEEVGDTRQSICIEGL